MKFSHILACTWLGMIPAVAQDVISDGWRSIRPPSLEEIAESAGRIPVAVASEPVADKAAKDTTAKSASPTIRALVTPTPTAGGNVADEITPEISELARGLRYDPTLIYEFVRNRVDFEPYYGCKKGAHMTLLEMSGNDMDQSALLVALLRASGYSPSYRSGAVAFSPNQHILWHGMSPTPYSDKNNTQFAQYIGTTASNPDLPNLRMYYGLTEYLTGFGYPIVQRVTAGSSSLYGIPHVWVQVSVGGTTYQLSPSFKQYDWLPGIDIVAATGYSKSQLISDADPTNQSDSTGTLWVHQVDYGKISNRLRTYTNNLLIHIRANHDLKPADEVFSSKRLVRKAIASLADADPLIVYSDAWATPETWTSTTIPVSRMSKVNITAGVYSGGSFSSTLFNLTEPLPLPALKGRKLSLAFSGNTATFRLDESTLQNSFSLSAATTQVRLAVTHDVYKLTYSGGSYTKTDTQKANQTTVQTYTKANGNAYAFPYSYSDSRKLLRARQEILARYKRNGIADGDWRVRTEVLNVMGLEWYSQSWRTHRMIAALDGGASIFMHRIGRVGQEANFYIDIICQLTASQHRGQELPHTRNIDRVSAMFMSAMEHGVLEQLQPNRESVSTVEAIYQANKDYRIYRATAANWSQVTGVNFYDDLPSIQSAVSAGAVALLPVSGNINIGDWWGEGYALEHPALTEMKISGNLNGGFSVEPGSAGSVLVMVWGNSSASYASTPGNVIAFTYTPETTPQMSSVDPVDLLSGAFFMDRTDLDLSGGSVLGLSSSRNYNSHRRHENSAGMGYGWTHNNHIRLVERSSTGAMLGETNSYQMAPLAVAALAAGGLHFEHTTAKQWVSSCLAVRWGIECLKNTAVSISFGNRTLEFIRMPDGTYVAPPGVKMSLVKNGDGTWLLTERHGDACAFDSSGKITSITNTSGKRKQFGYSGDKLTTVTDAFNRVLTHVWNGNSISSITDGTRSISFAYDGTGNLTGVTDAENHTWTYRYDADRRMDQTKDPESRILIENDYDTQNRVKAQRSKGEPNRTWLFTWSGFFNVEENPYGELTTYFYDNRGRSTGVTNHLGESTQIGYDGQDRIYATTTPKGETTYSAWNADHNLTGTIDPRLESTGYFYDTSLRLQRSRDKRGKETTYTYTAAHLLESVTDPLLHTTSYAYNANGLLWKVTDAEGKITETGHDGNGYPNLISMRESAASPLVTVKTLTNDAYGNILTETDGAGRTVTNTWNKKRQLRTQTWAIVDGIPCVRTNVYDPSGNLESATDANNNTTSYKWNQLAKPTDTTLPALSTGNHVITTGYDLRDWPDSTTDSLNRVNSKEYDAAGRIASVTDALTRKTEIFYDLNGQPNLTIDPLNRTTIRNWTVRGENRNQIDGMGKSTDFTYDPNGNLTHRQNRRGKTFVTTFDNANRPDSTTTPTGKTTSTIYYNNNQVRTITEASGQTTTLIYNERKLLKSKTDPTGIISYHYDTGGLLQTVTEGGVVITRTYDARGRLDSYKRTVDGTDEFTLWYKWDANGNLKRLTYPDGKQVHYTYNSRNLMDTVTDWTGRQTIYEYDRAGRLVGIDRPYNHTKASFTLDAADQVKEIRESRNGSLFSYLNFGFDPAGQIRSRLQAPIIQPAQWQHPVVDATYDDDNRLATVNGLPAAHDSDGNMTGGPISATSGPVSLVYNSRNQLTSAGGISYSYDAEGNRRTMTDNTGTTKFVVDPSSKLNRLLEKVAPDGERTYYVYGLGLLYEVDESNASKTHHFDQVGSTVVRTDDSGSVIARASYSPYGLPVLKQGDLDTPFLYNGRTGIQTDSNGLLNMRARYYSPYLMRFLNADPIGFSGGANWFAYADGNPISLSDPFGLCAESGRGFWEGLTGYSSWEDYSRDAGDTIGGIAIGLSEGLSGGAIGIDATTVYQMNESQLTGYHSGIVISLIGAFLAPKASPGPEIPANGGGRAVVAIGEDLSSAAGTRVWRNVPEGHGALADAQSGIVKPYGPTMDAPLDARAVGHDIGYTEGSGLSSWSANYEWVSARQQRLGGVILETSAPDGSIWFNNTARGAETQVLIPGKINATRIK